MDRAQISILLIDQDHRNFNMAHRSVESDCLIPHHRF